MTFAEAVAVLRRHKLLVTYGVLVALLLATFATNRLDGAKLVSRDVPVYESRAVVAVRPGVEQTTTTVATATTLAEVPVTVVDGDPAATVAVTTTTTTVNAPPLAPLPAVIDSRAMYYTALSLKTIVVSPGFAEAVKNRAPTTDGSVTAVVAQDTNTMVVVVDGSTPQIAETTMAAALAELQSVIATYSSTPATRFSLDGVVISAPSAPSATSSIKGPLTAAIVVVVVLALWWLLIRGVDDVRRASRRSKRAAAERRAAAAHRVGVSSDEAAATTNGARPIHVASPQPGGAAGTPSAAGNGQRPEPAAPVR